MCRQDNTTITRTENYEYNMNSYMTKNKTHWQMGHHQTLVLGAIQPYRTFINFLIDFSALQTWPPWLEMYM